MLSLNYHNVRCKDVALYPKSEKYIDKDSYHTGINTVQYVIYGCVRMAMIGKFDYGPGKFRLISSS